MTSKLFQVLVFLYKEEAKEIFDVVYYANSVLLIRCSEENC